MPRFNERYSHKPELQLLQDSNQTNGDNLKVVRHQGSIHFRNIKREYLKSKITEFSTNTNNIENIRTLCSGINKFERSYQPRTKWVIHEKCDPFYNTLSKWNNYFPQLLNVCGVSDVRQTEIHAAEPLCLGLVLLRLTLPLQR
jgi:hypothetical protein